MKKKILLIIGIMIFILGQIGTIYLIYRDKNNNPISKTQFKNKEDNSNLIAIMLEQDDGTYKLTESTSFNQPGYEFNSEKSGCIDTNGNKIENALSYDNDTKTVVVITRRTAYCYVYFDKMSTGPNELIPPLASDDEIAYDETIDNNLRYIGADPNNYVYFNCSNYNNPTASTCEKWRIIGAFNNMKTGAGETKTLLKIIRNESLGEYFWDYKQKGVGSSTSSYGSSSYGSNDWEDSQLMLMLNGVTLGNYKSGYIVNGDYLHDRNNIAIMNISGSYYEGSSITYKPTYTTTSGYSSTDTIDFSNTGLKNDATRGMIENVIWKLGGTSDFKSNSNGLASHFYSYERNNIVCSGCPTEWTGKIGLMYASDYGFATGGGSTTNRATCLATAMYNWSSSSVRDCKNNNWLFMGSQWLLTPSTYNADSVFIVFGSGIVNSYSVYSNFSYNVWPSVYLTSNAGINGGSGTIDDPYHLTY